MLASQAALTVANESDPIVVLAADDNFAMPLAATVRSALDNLAPSVKLRIFVLDGGLKDATKTRLLESWPVGRFDIQWLAVDARALAGLPVSGHVNLVSYFRLLIPRILPQDVRRAIYLDADLIVCADLTQLWNCDLKGQLCLAAQDCAAPYLDSSQVLANYRLCGRHLSSPRPVPNFRSLGLKPQAPYFNAGVMLIDLAAWRDADVSGQLLECLKQHHEHVLWWDQYALNVVLAGRWEPLDMRWNQGLNIFKYPTWPRSPFDRQTYERVRNDPYIVHFTTLDKPWHPLCRHPLRRRFFEYLDRTAWGGWRPTRGAVARELVKSFKRRLRQGRKAAKRRLAQWLHGPPIGEHSPS